MVGIDIPLCPDATLTPLIVSCIPITQNGLESLVTGD